MLFERIPDKKFNDFLINIQAEWYKKMGKSKGATGEEDKTEQPKSKFMDMIQDVKYKFDHLIIKENILSFVEIRDLQFLQQKLRFLHSELYKFIYTNQESHFRGIHCFECAKAIESKFGKCDINVAQKCRNCHKYFHKLSPLELIEYNKKMKTQSNATDQKTDSNEEQETSTETSVPHHEPEYRLHKSCLEVHLCAGLFENQFARLQKMEEMEEDLDESVNQSVGVERAQRGANVGVTYTNSQTLFMMQGQKIMA